MTLSARARSVWAKFGYDPESRHWLPLWLHLLDAAAVAEHLARTWLTPTAGDLIEREFAGSTSGLPPADEFRLLASWIAASTTSESAPRPSPSRSRTGTTA